MKIALKYPYLFLVLIFSLFAPLFWYQNLYFAERDNLKVAFLDVGQGDAIFIETPNRNQIIIDAGPNSKIIRELSKHMSFFDNSIDVIVVTNPDRDHIAGFLDILKKFDVGLILEPGTKTNTQVYKQLEKLIADEKSDNGAPIKKVIVQRGMDFLLDKDVHLLILFPDKDVSGMTTNDGSVVAKLVYKNTSIILTGDAPSKTERYLITLENDLFATSTAHLKSDILKVGHHGSKTSTSQDFLQAVMPSYAIISAGKNNSYGHPSSEVVSRLTENKIKTLGTYAEGSIVFESDGERWYEL
jgi:competence protein ComEC